MKTVENIISKLKFREAVTEDEIKRLLECNETEREVLMNAALEVKKQVFGDKVYVRGLIEISNYCKNDCLYCGIRRSNKNAHRYRLTPSEIVECAAHGYSLGFRTFVLQGGEDAFFTDEVLCEIIKEIKAKCDGSAVTLSLGERGYESFRKLREVGADRYLLRHESADPDHYARLHPKNMTLDKRLKCLEDLKKLGYQTGCGFMVGSPYQTLDHVAGEFAFLKDFSPHMVGLGPFIPHNDTPFAKEKSGSLDVTLKCLAIVRLMMPSVLLPATTALATLRPEGRQLGLLAGANVVMPNLSPVSVREKYALYNDKLSTGGESAEGLATLEKELKTIGCVLSMERGDWCDTNTNTEERR